MRSFTDTVRDGYTLVVDDQFTGTDLDPAIWFPYYLPQWSSRQRAAARHRMTGTQLHLVIDDDQPPWSEALDGPLRVSSLQTGVFAGPLGSTVGQHRVHPTAVVTEEQAVQRLLTPQYGAFSLRAAWDPHPDQLVALWMIGFEDRPDRSAEICIVEIFGSEVGPRTATVGMGVHPFGDPTITDDFAKVELDIDVRDLHDYAAVWTNADVHFFVDDRPVFHVEQSPAYPMQFMLNIYDFGRASSTSASGPFVVDRFRCWDPPADATSGGPLG